MDIITRLQQELEGIKTTPVAESFGRIEKIGDGIALCSGIDAALASEMIELYPRSAGQKPEEVAGSPLMGLALNIEEYQVGVVVLGDYLQLQEGDVVKTTGRVLEVPAGEELLGGTYDPLGRSLEGKTVSAKHRMPVERVAPGVIEREEVKDRKSVV